MLILDQDLLRAKLFHGLKSLESKGDSLQPRFLEISICESFGFRHVGDSAFYADGVTASEQLSIKTRMINPHILKTKESRDFQSHPEYFIGPNVNQKQNKWTNGLEIVQRRQQLDLKNDSTADAKTVGKETLKGFISNIAESTKKYQTSKTYEVVSVHGYNRTSGFYLMSLFWKEYDPLDASKISWVREGNSVAGYLDDNGINKKICERINGNAKREATCFKEYKDLTKYQHSAQVRVPIPDLWSFDKDKILAEIALLESK